MQRHNLCSHRDHPIRSCGERLRLYTCIKHNAQTIFLVVSSSLQSPVACSSYAARHGDTLRWAAIPYRLRSTGQSFALFGASRAQQDGRLLVRFGERCVLFFFVLRDDSCVEDDADDCAYHSAKNAFQRVCIIRRRSTFGGRSSSPEKSTAAKRKRGKGLLRCFIYPSNFLLEQMAESWILFAFKLFKSWYLCKPKWVKLLFIWYQWNGVFYRCARLRCVFFTGTKLP